MKRFLVAYRKGMHDFHDAFIGRRRQARMGRPTREARCSASCRNSPACRPTVLEQGDPLCRRRRAASPPPTSQHQIAWYKSQNLLKGDVKAEAIIDKRYALPLVAAR